MSPYPLTPGLSRRAGSAVLLAASLLLSACGGGSAAARPVSAPGSAPVTVLEPERLEESPEILKAEITKPKRDLLGTVHYDLPVEGNSWVEAELDFLVNQRSAVIGRWIERGDAYSGFIKQELRSAGLPTDLFHLAMIESAMLPNAKSRVGAVGFWQFMPGTARELGLRIDGQVDERMDPVRSTRAAARHLRSLYRMYNDWALAAAAYNAGSGRISRGLQKFGVRDFWALAQEGDLAAETKQYVPRLYAMTIITRDRARFGFPAPAATQDFAYDSINVEFATPLQELAKISEVPQDQLRKLNPHLVQDVTPAGGYWVWVPAGKGIAMQRAYLSSDFRREQGYGTYLVRSGDNLGKLAELSGLSTKRIKELNPKVDFQPLQIGEKLRLPYKTAETLAARGEEKEAEKTKVAKAEEKKEKSEEKKSEEKKESGKRADDDLSEDGDTSAAKEKAEEKKEKPEEKKADAGRSHTVEPGETLSGIAREYDLTVEALREANDLSGTTIRSGQKLKLPVAEKVVKKEEKKDSGKKSGTKAEKKKEPEAAEHVVKSGETLWGIARKYDTTVDALEELNELGKKPIRPGQKLIVPKG